MMIPDFSVVSVITLITHNKSGKCLLPANIDGVAHTLLCNNK